MEAYGQFCPVSKAAEVLCRRWTLLIVRELLSGSTRFNEIRRGVPSCSPTLLSQRLKELERAGVIEIEGVAQARRYLLTSAGSELLPVVLSIGMWGQRWTHTDYGPDDLDPGLLLWDIRRNVAPGGLGSVPTTIKIVFPALTRAPHQYWLVVDTHDVDLCITDPGREVDVTMEADLRCLTEIWMGDARFADALADGRIVLHGPKALTRRIPSWIGHHPHFANAVD